MNESINHQKSTLINFLQSHSTLTLATVDGDGQPMAASLFFVADEDLNVYWVSGPNSRHSINVSRRARAALTVHAETWSWADIAGVQMEGEVSIVPAGAEWEYVWGLYRAKFPFAQDFEAEVSRSNFYRFTPRWARWMDNAHGFGYKEELTF
jgi:hypothetical protein